MWPIIIISNDKKINKNIITTNQAIVGSPTITTSTNKSTIISTNNLTSQVVKQVLNKDSYMHPNHEGIKIIADNLFPYIKSSINILTN